ncbi:ribosome maturation factor RimM, partial [bacterium M00.F.Ca.ET.168.01.1.1]
GVIGKVVAVHNFGGGDILDVTLAGRKGVLIPFTQAAVPHVSIAEGFVQVDPMAAGLVDDEESEAPGRSGFDPKGRPRGPKDAGGNR